VQKRVTYYTTLAGAFATCQAIDQIDHVDPHKLQDLHRELRA
jgi:hypothetical protein